MADDDEDVIIEGSALHQHLKNNGFDDDLELFLKNNHDGAQEDEADNKSKLLDVKTVEHVPDAEAYKFQSLLQRMTSLVTDSDLLVDEDVEFLKSFILDDLRRSSKSQTSLLSTAAAGGAFLASLWFLRRRSIIETSLFSLVIVSCSIMFQVRREFSVDSKLLQDTTELLNTCDQFKTVIKKSLNFIKGMEIVNHGYNRQAHNQEKDPVQFISLRRSVNNSLVKAIDEIKSGTKILCREVNLREEFDNSKHFLASVSNETFCLSNIETDDNLSVSNMKETVNIFLLLLSEFLRRFCLSLVLDIRINARYENDVNNLSSIVQRLITTVSENVQKTSNILKFSQAEGCLFNSD